MRYDILYKYRHTIKRSGNEQFDNLQFINKELQEIRLYSFSLNQASNDKIKKRGFIIELHSYNGFSLVKFYPRGLKNNPKKYELRCEQIGYVLPFGLVRNILWQCAHLMKHYLDCNPDHFIGYVGQTDYRDNLPNRLREKSQRSSIYDTCVSSLFKIPKYNISSDDLFGPINLKFIRTLTKHKELTLTKEQQTNYNNLIQFLERHRENLPLLMTEASRSKFYENKFV